MSWLDDLFTKKPKEDWKLVHSITMKCSVGDDHKNEKVYYHLFESSYGNRKVETTATSTVLTSGNWDSFKEGNDTYQEKVYPWVHGAMDPDIPVYGDVAKKEMLKYLQKDSSKEDKK